MSARLGKDPKCRMWGAGRGGGGMNMLQRLGCGPLVFEYLSPAPAPPTAVKPDNISGR